MIIDFDSEIFLLQEKGGVSKYFSEIIAEFRRNKSHQIDPRMTFRRSNNIHLRDIDSNIKPLVFPYVKPNSPKRALATYGPIKFTNSILSSRPIINRSHQDFFHATYYRPNLLERLGVARLAVTLHDFIPEKLGWNGIRNPHIGKRSLVRKSDLVFAVSRSTADDLLDFYGELEVPVVVVPHGVREVGNRYDKLSTPQIPVVLYVGERAGYKNFVQLAKAISNLWQSGQEINLITVGSTFSQAEFDSLFARGYRKFWKHFQFLEDGALRNLYRTSSVLCMTSRMEGFGLPMLEALAQGTAVIASDIPISREVCGDQARYFEVGNIDSLMHAILGSIENSHVDSEIDMRITWAAERTWNKSARLMADAYFQFSH